MSDTILTREDLLTFGKRDTAIDVFYLEKKESSAK